MEEIGNSKEDIEKLKEETHGASRRYLTRSQGDRLPYKVGLVFKVPLGPQTIRVQLVAFLNLIQISMMIVVKMMNIMKDACQLHLNTKR